MAATNINNSTAVAEMGDRLATINMDRKVGAAVPLSVGELGPQNRRDITKMAITSVVHSEP